MKYLIKTFGCQMNERDSEIIAGMLHEMGYSKTDNIDAADLIIFNTCCVRESAENKIYGKIGELKHLKNKNPDLIIGICGCMAQRPEAAEKIRKSYPYVNLIFGTHNLHELPDMIKKIQYDRGLLINVWEEEGEIIEGLPSKRVSNLMAWVAITYGCNNFCTYCIVPYVRGRERSRSLKDIVAEVEQLGKEGVKEITLLGQNVNSYGKDLKEDIDFADLLEVLDEIPGIERIRYMTSHPRDFTDKLIDVIANSNKVCEHFHLPVQSGSNRILKLMNRGYNREQYKELVRKIRVKIPEASITTDIIVGFPEETEEDFADTIELVEDIRYDAAFTFIFNKRSGTPAAKMENQVPENIKRKRIQKLINLQNQITLEKNQEQVGKVLDVLVEARNDSCTDMMSGRSRSNKYVVFPGNDSLIGQSVKVKITGAKMWNLEGEII